MAFDRYEALRRQRESASRLDPAPQIAAFKRAMTTPYQSPFTESGRANRAGGAQAVMAAPVPVQPVEPPPTDPAPAPSIAAPELAAKMEQFRRNTQLDTAPGEGAPFDPGPNPTGSLNVLNRDAGYRVGSDALRRENAVTTIDGGRDAIREFTNGASVGNPSRQADAIAQLSPDQRRSLQASGVDVGGIMAEGGYVRNRVFNPVTGGYEDSFDGAPVRADSAPIGDRFVYSEGSAARTSRINDQLKGYRQEIENRQDGVSGAISKFRQTTLPVEQGRQGTQRYVADQERAGVETTARAGQAAIEEKARQDRIGTESTAQSAFAQAALGFASAENVAKINAAATAEEKRAEMKRLNIDSQALIMQTLLTAQAAETDEAEKAKLKMVTSEFLERFRSNVLTSEDELFALEYIFTKSDLSNVVSAKLTPELIK